MEELAFDVPGTFDEDYLFFYEARLSPERSDAEVELLWRLLGLRPVLASSISPAVTAASRIGWRSGAAGLREQTSPSPSWDGPP
jgi:hypothetical protein